MYDPKNVSDRTELAAAILAMLARAGFREASYARAGQERVFSRVVDGTDGRISVMVYTSIVGDQVREVGEDAIRVALVYQDRIGDGRGLAKETRVHRTGEVGAIVERLLGRMRQSYGKARDLERCHCGAPKFVSKRGNLCCVELCWKTAGAAA